MGDEKLENDARVQDLFMALLIFVISKYWIKWDHESRIFATMSTDGPAKSSADIGPPGSLAYGKIRMMCVDEVMC